MNFLKPLLQNLLGDEYTVANRLERFGQFVDSYPEPSGRTGAMCSAVQQRYLLTPLLRHAEQRLDDIPTRLSFYISNNIIFAY